MSVVSDLYVCLLVCVYVCVEWLVHAQLCFKVESLSPDVRLKCKPASRDSMF
jgi:hypothetical protein